MECRPHDPWRRLDEDLSFDDTVAAEVIAGTAVADLGVWADGHRVSDADQVPDRLHLEEDGDPFEAFGGAIVEPVEPGVGHATRTA